MKIFKYEEYTIAQDSKRDFTIVEKNNNFFKLDNATFDSLFGKEKLEFVKNDKDNILYMMGMIFMILLTLYLYFRTTTYSIIDVNFLPATLVLIINIFIHELGHVLFLKKFYPKSRVKIGFKFMFKGVFVITFNAIWMLMETLCNYILLTYCPQYAAVRQVGSFVSKIFFNAVILALKKVFTDDDIKELPVRYSILLVLIPTGSIYIMNNIFMLGFANNNGRTRINSTFTVLILLGMNILIFYVYMKLADDLRLRRMAAVYEQQLELCERHQQERELSMLQLRDIKHNMKL